MQKGVKHDPCPGAHGLEEDMYKQRMKKVQSNYELCIEGKDQGKLQRGHIFHLGLEEREFY